MRDRYPVTKGCIKISLLTLLGLLALPAVSMATDQEIQVVTVNSNDGNTALPDSVPYNEIMLDWSAWPRNPREPITECYIWGGWNTPRLWVPAAGGRRGQPWRRHRRGGYWFGADFDDIAGNSSHRFDSLGNDLWTKDADRCWNEDDCYGFVDDRGTDPHGVAPAGRLTVCNSDPEDEIPDCGIAPQGRLYTQVVRPEGRFSLICLRESVEGLQEVHDDYGPEDFPAPTLEVSGQFDGAQRKFILTATTSFATEISIENCPGGTPASVSLDGGADRTTTFTCNIEQKSQTFSIVATNGFPSDTGTVTKTLRMSLGEISLDPPYYEQWSVFPNNYDQDQPGTVQIGYRFSRTGQIDEVDGSTVLQTLARASNLPWIQSVLVVGVLSPGAPGSNQILAWDNVRTPQDANKMINVPREFLMNRYQIYLIDLDGTMKTASPTPTRQVRRWIWNDPCSWWERPARGIWCEVEGDGRYVTQTVAIEGSNETRPGLIHLPFPGFLEVVSMDGTYGYDECYDMCDWGIFEGGCGWHCDDYNIAAHAVVRFRNLVALEGNCDGESTGGFDHQPSRDDEDLQSANWSGTYFNAWRGHRNGDTPTATCRFRGLTREGQWIESSNGHAWGLHIGPTLCDGQKNYSGGSCTRRNFGESVVVGLAY